MIKNNDVPKGLKDFNSFFYEFNYKYDVSIIFDDLLSLIICAMARGTEEPRYFEIIKKYTRSELDIFCKLFGELMLYYEKYIDLRGWCDPLGEYYECLAGQYKKSNFGQFFTPIDLCTMLAQMLIPSDDFGKKINDPASGSGRLILAANYITKGNYYICQDLDPICCKMTAINLCFHGINAEVHRMDSIANTKPSFSLATNHNYWKNKVKSILYYPSA